MTNTVDAAIISTYQRELRMTDIAQLIANLRKEDIRIRRTIRPCAVILSEMHS